MLSIVALLVFIVGILLVYLPSSKMVELGRAMLWIGLAILVWHLAGWHASRL